MKPNLQHPQDRSVTRSEDLRMSPPTNCAVRCLLIFFPFATAIVAASAAHGQPLFKTIDSLEWMAADSKVIVHASITDVAREAAEGNNLWDTVTIKVYHTLKGEHQDTLKFAVTHSLPSSKDEDRLNRWKDSAEELLLFLVDSKHQRKFADKYLAHELALRTADWWGWSVVRLGPRQERRDFTQDVFTLDFKVIEDPKEILHATKTAVAEAAKSKHVRKHQIRLPRDVAKKTQWFGQHIDLAVPVDDRLEKAARRWIKSPGDALPRIDEYRPKENEDLGPWEAWLQFEKDHCRLEGARALGYFKSDENIAILKGLLDDPAFWTEVDEKEGRLVDKERVYFVREAAYGALKQWGVCVPKPVVRQPLSGNER